MTQIDVAAPKVREITVFSIGDSRKLSSWSNVPYFFTQTLIEKGLRVNRIDIGKSLVGKVLNKTIWKLQAVVGKHHYYDYSRSRLHYLCVKLKIRLALALYPSSEANIFLTFSVSSAGMSRKPTILFCDWTYDHHFRYFLNQEPDAAEEASMRREDAEIEAADLVLVLFPRVSDYMRTRYENPNIQYLGNVVNALSDLSEPAAVLHKKASDEILFIGGGKYLEGARELIAAFALLKRTHPSLKLNIIGMKASHFPALPTGVVCHGYLDKEKESDRKLYYALLTTAKVIVNTTPKWGAFSATLEAMYFYTPVITTPYEEFVATFGRDIAFGYYCPDNAGELLFDSIQRVIGHADYLSLCRASHAAVQCFTWGGYIEKVLSRISSLSSPSRQRSIINPAE